MSPSRPIAPFPILAALGLAIGCKAPPSSGAATAPADSVSAKVAVPTTSTSSNPSTTDTVAAIATMAVAPSASASTAPDDVGMTCSNGMLLGSDAVTGYQPPQGGQLGGPGILGNPPADWGGLKQNGGGITGGEGIGGVGGTEGAGGGITGIGNPNGAPFVPAHTVVNVSGHTVRLAPKEETAETSKAICLVFPAIEPCFGTAAASAPIDGTVELDLAVEVGGAVKSVSTSGGTLTSATLTKCVTDALAKVTLGKPKTAITFGYVLKAQSHVVPASGTPGVFKPPTANVTIGAFGGGGLSDGPAVVARNRWRFKACYMKALALDPSLAGAIKVNAKVGENGEVTASSVASNDTGSSPFASCVAGAFRSMKFTPPDTGSASIVVPFVFSSVK